MSSKQDIQLDEQISVKLPKQYRVILLNDDYTSMEFVVEILMEIFHKSASQSESIMLQIHNNGSGICGIYSYEIAETKAAQVHKRARDNGFPLKAVLEKI